MPVIVAAAIPISFVTPGYANCTSVCGCKVEQAIYFWYAKCELWELLDFVSCFKYRHNCRSLGRRYSSHRSAAVYHHLLLLLHYYSLLLWQIAATITFFVSEGAKNFLLFIGVSVSFSKV